MRLFFKSIFLNNRFFYAGGVIVVIMFLGFFWPLLIGPAFTLMGLLGLATLMDVFLLWRKSGITASRIMSEKFSNGDENIVKIPLVNKYGMDIGIRIIDELPEQMQERNFKLTGKLKSGTSKTMVYKMRPRERGVFSFGALNIFVTSAFSLVSRRYIFDADKEVPVYPSYIHLDRYDIRRIGNDLNFPGIKKVRRIGHSMEFEQIKEYVAGDDWRSVNWKATSKTAKLMVNQYMEEKAQPVYCLIDTGRMMKMPFDGLTLLDHCINSVLVLSHVVISNQDKAGLATFSRKLENFLPAERRTGQMHLILEKLYRIRTDYKESDFGRLYNDIRRLINQRSLLLLYTNFDTIDALRRQLKYLRGIAKGHVLLIIFFKNTEMEAIKYEEALDIREIYDRAVVEKFNFEQRLIVNELRKYGIYSILTEPRYLTVDLINKYLEVKARGLI
ncbi:MAG TPA: DUF58 domain-containing protein [Saprospiraceae bacterium]|nr:DUF58 domain-containing protein [Saprospiraceae bacterium]HRP85278.1 DUF58 domain-containing protein [Saprospiraceae bacterium]